MSYSSRRILVGIEDSESSTRVLEYVADLVRDGSSFVIHLLHAVGPVPVELREFQGAENPKTERQLDSQLHQTRDDWMLRAKTEALPLVEDARLQLTGHRHSRERHHNPSHRSGRQTRVHRRDLQNSLKESLRHNRCGTKSSSVV